MAKAYLRCPESSSSHRLSDNKLRHFARKIGTEIFRRCFTTKEVGKGTGLELLEGLRFHSASLGGDVRGLRGEIGGGTTADACIGRARCAASKPEPPMPAREALRGEGKILIVEDNAQVGDVSVMMLERLGYEVVRADRPAAAAGYSQAPERDPLGLQRHRHAGLTWMG